MFTILASALKRSLRGQGLFFLKIRHHICIFLHIFSLGNVTSPVYIVCGDYSLMFGTKSKSSRACSDVCEMPTGTESKKYPCFEPQRPRCSKSDRLPLNDERLGVLYGNHIRPLIRRRIALSRYQRIIYGLRTKGCYTDTQKSLESYTETIYTLLGRSNWKDNIVSRNNVHGCA